MSSYTDAAQPRYDFVARLLERDFPPPARVVELGSAPGYQISALARRGYEATSVDLGAAEDEWGSGGPGRFREILNESDVTHSEWDLEKVPYPFKDGMFDAALLTEVIEHLREYPARSLMEVRRIIRPGGRLYLTTPNSTYVMNRLRLAAGRTVYTPLPDWVGGLPHARHAREYTFDEIEELLRYSGFNVLERHSRHFHVTSGNKTSAAQVGKMLLDGIARVRPTLGPSIVIVAERT